MGMSPVVGATGQIDRDNPYVADLMNGTGPTKDGDRYIISFTQYSQLHNTDRDSLSQYSIRMFFPGYAGVMPVQATKYLKWYGRGYRAVGDPEYSQSVKVSRPSRNTTSTDIVDEAVDKLPTMVGGSEDSLDDPAVTVYFCHDKYPECRRFFDTEKGLKFHWRNDHEGGFRKPRAPKAQVEAPKEE